MRAEFGTVAITEDPLFPSRVVLLRDEDNEFDLDAAELRWLCAIGGPAILSQLPEPEPPDPYTNEGRRPLPPFDQPEPPHPDQVEMEL